MIKEPQIFLQNLRGKQLGFVLPLAILIIAVLIAAGTVGYSSYKTSQTLEESSEGLEVLKPEQVTDEADEISEIDETIEWVVYDNEKHGYSFKYPSVCRYGPLLPGCKQWPPEERPEECLCFLNDEAFSCSKNNCILLQSVKKDFPIYLEIDHFGGSLYSPPKDADLIDWLKEYFENIPDIPNAEIDGIPTVKISTRSPMAGHYDEYFYIKDDKLFKILINVENKEFYDVFFSTFKFIELESEEEEESIIPDTPIMKNIDTYATPDIPYAIRWVPIGEVDESATYTLERDINSSFSNPATVYTGSSNRFTETLSPSDTTRYFFRVKACNQHGCSSWSSITLLVIEVVKAPTAPNVPVLNDPGDSIKPFIDPAGAVEASYKLSWPPVEGATSYVLHVNSSYSFDAEWNPTWGFHEHNIKGYHKYMGFGVPKVSSPVVFYYRVKAVNDYGESAWSNIVDIEVLPPEPSIAISSPNGGEMWRRGEVARISWSSDGVDSARIRARDANNGDIFLIAELNYNPHYYDWAIPADLTLSDKYEIEVADLNNPQVCDWSYKYFRIVSQSAFSQSITLISPNGGEVWRVGETHQITWNTVEVDAVKIYIFDPSIFGSGSTNYITPANISITGTPGRYSWTIPSQLPGGGGNNYKIRIVDANNSQIDDKSDDFFSIIVP